MRLSFPASVSVVIASALFVSAASAQYVGPSNTPSYASVAEVLKNPVDDAPVVLVGYLVKQVGNEKYLFSDGKSEIRADIDHKLFPAAPVNERTRVQIRGEIEKDFLQSPEIDVEHLQIVD